MNISLKLSYNPLEIHKKLVPWDKDNLMNISNVDKDFYINGLMIYFNNEIYIITINNIDLCYASFQLSYNDKYHNLYIDYINYDINLMILKLDDGNSINIIEMVNIKRSLIIVYTIYPA